MDQERHESDKQVPPATTGKSNDLNHHVAFATATEASTAYGIARERLLHPSAWQALSGAGSAYFHLTDQEGQDVVGAAAPGMLLRIGIPGPGHADGSGDDWVCIEHLQEDPGSDPHHQWIQMRVRPVSSPLVAGEHTSHFFDGRASSSFEVERRESIVIARYHGRNETPNTEGKNLLDKARNMIVAIGALIGLSELQWNGLLKGLIPDPAG